MRLTILASLLCTLATASFAADGDTIHVQTVPFGGPNSGKFLFPPQSVHYAKVLMHYSVRCPCDQYDRINGASLDVHRTNPDTVIHYEIFRYISPFGINRDGSTLNLGPDGFPWTQDLTDFSPLLHDSVSLSVSASSQVSLTFDLILGTPPRDVLSVEPLWMGSPRYGMTPPIDSFLTPRMVSILPQARGVRLKVIQTGHGEDNHMVGPDNIPCEEFCDHVQSVLVNDSIRDSRHVFRASCGLNPVISNGTWVYNRANWCPGASVDPFDYELGKYCTPGGNAKIQLSMEPYTYAAGATNDNTTPYFDISSAIVQYGASNFQNDAAVEDIYAPSTTAMHRRRNPICGGPSIKVRCTGANDLTSLTIDYGVKGGGHTTYQWSGRIATMQSDTIHLPPFNWGSWNGANIFEVTISKPNGAADEYAPNNYAWSAFDTLPMWYNDIEFQLRTNKFAAQQYEWWLWNADGVEIGHANNLDDNTTYIDTFHLADGCYEYRLLNYLQYGLSWPYVSQQIGSGSLSFTSKGATVKSFNGDFGAELFQQFRVGPMPTIAQSTDSLKYGYVAVGGSRQLTARLFPTTSVGVQVSSVGLVLARGQFSLVSTVPTLQNGPVTLAPGDTMDINVVFQPTSAGSKFAKLTVASNDQRKPVSSFTLTGTTDSTAGVEDPLIPRDIPELRVSPTVFSSMTTVAVAGASTHSRVSLVDILGRSVATLFDGGTTDPAPSAFPLSAAGISPGSYFVFLETPAGTRSVPVVIVR